MQKIWLYFALISSIGLSLWGCSEIYEQKASQITSKKQVKTAQSSSHQPSGFALDNAGSAADYTARYRKKDNNQPPNNTILQDNTQTAVMNDSIVKNPNPNDTIKNDTTKEPAEIATKELGRIFSGLKQQ